MYVCGLVIPVPADRMDAYRRWAENGAAFGQITAGARDEALYLILSTLGLPLDSGSAVLRRSLHSQRGCLPT